MEIKGYRIIYIVTSISLNIVLCILAFIPFIISLSYAIYGKFIEKMHESISNRIEGFITIIFIILFMFGVNFVLYKLISQKANLKWKWGIIPFTTIVITNIYIVIAQNLW